MCALASTYCLVHAFHYKCSNINYLFIASKQTSKDTRNFWSTPWSLEWQTALRLPLDHSEKATNNRFSSLKAALLYERWTSNGFQNWREKRKKAGTILHLTLISKVLVNCIQAEVGRLLMTFRILRNVLDFSPLKILSTPGVLGTNASQSLGVLWNCLKTLKLK